MDTIDDFETSRIVKPGPRKKGVPLDRRYSEGTTARTLLGLGAFRDDADHAMRRPSGPAGPKFAARGGLRQRPSPEDVEGVYIISVAARILEMHPQTLRKYERAGLVTPSRTGGMLRLYSEEDIARLKLIKHLVGDLGLNVAGVQLVLEVFNNLLATRSRLSSTEDKQLRGFMSESLDRMFELLHAHVR